MAITDFPFRIGPINNITPFTYRDGVTYLEILYKLRDYVNETLRPEFDAEMERIIEEFNAGIANAEEHFTVTKAAIDAAQAALTTYVNTETAEARQYVDDAIELINNKTGQIEIQRATLAAPYTVTIDPLWPTNHPVAFVLTQDATGGRAITFAANIKASGIISDTQPNGVTEFVLVPDGDGNWHAIQPETKADQVKVTSFGKNVGSGDAAIDTAAVQRAINYAAENNRQVVFPAGKTYRCNKITANAGARILVESGAEILAYDAEGIFLQASGTLTATASLSGGVVLGSKTVTVASAAGFAVGDTILVYSDNVEVVPGTSTKRGYLRKITAIAGLTFTVDGPWPYTLTGNVPVTKVAMAPAVVIEGGGTIKGNAVATQTKALIDLNYVNAPILSGVTLGPGGGPGQQLTSCVGGWTAAHFVDLTDDSAGGHFGYAVNWAGATRGHVVRGGSATRVRHGVTTTGAATVLGEPENCAALPGFVVSEGKNAAFDTHEQGIGIVLMGTAINCTIGFQDRSLNTIMGGMVSGATLYGYHVTASAVNSLLLNPVVLNMGTDAGAAAFRLRAVATLDTPEYPVASAANSINADTDYVLRGGGRLAGVKFQAAGKEYLGFYGGANYDRSASLELLDNLFTMGLIGSGNHHITSRLQNLTATGPITGRTLTSNGTAVTDVTLRTNAVSGQTADLAQFRVNGTSKVNIGPAGDVDIRTTGAGVILQAPNGTRYRLTVDNAGAPVFTVVP
jgi:hypothetical protein